MEIHQIKYYNKHTIIFLWSLFLFSSSGTGQDSIDYQHKNFGIGLSISPVVRSTLVQSYYNSIGGAGYEIGLRARYWRTGLTFVLGRTTMQIPEIENLEYNRMNVVGGDLEYRLGAKQRWIVVAGYHRHIYNYKSKAMELMPGITVHSIENEIEQRARLLGGACQATPWLRLGMHYQWERIPEKNKRGIPSSSYLVFRASFMLDSNHLKSQKSAAVE